MTERKDTCMAARLWSEARKATGESGEWELRGVGMEVEGSGEWGWKLREVGSGEGK